MDHEKKRVLAAMANAYPDADRVEAHRISQHVYAVEVYEFEDDATEHVERFFVEVAPRRTDA